MTQAQWRKSSQSVPRARFPTISHLAHDAFARLKIE